MKGIETVKKAADILIGLANDIGKALEDGKFEAIEALQFTNELLLIPQVAQNWQELKSEIVDIDAVERAELIAYIKEKFDIPEDRIEAIAESALDLTLKGIDFGIGVYEFAKSLKQPDPLTDSDT